MHLRKVLLITALGFQSLALGACGNLTARGYTKMASSERTGAYASSANLSGGTSSDCAAKPRNVKPNYSGSGAGNFTACGTTEDYYTVEIHGEFPEDPLDVYGGTGSDTYDTICMFPGQYYPADNTLPARVVWKKDAQGFPMMKCQGITDEGVFAQFPKTNFDVLFIVKQSQSGQMRSCLVSGNEYNCPPFARGRFR